MIRLAVRNVLFRLSLEDWPLGHDEIPAIRPMLPKDIAALQIGAKKAAQLAEHIADPGFETFVILSGGVDVAGYCHLRHRPYDDPYFRRRFHVKSGEVLLIDDFVLPGFRGGGLHGASIRARLEHAARRGDHAVFALVATYNPVSERNFVQSGFIPVADVRTVGFRTLKKTWLIPRPPNRRRDLP